MVVWKIIEVKAFMAHLLLKDTFDAYLLSDAEITVANTFHMNGRIHGEWFDGQEEAEAYGEGYSYWRDLRQLVYQIIRGKKPPLSIKIIFRLPREIAEPFLYTSGTGYHLADVDGLFWNLHYERGQLFMTAGVSMQTFTMDRSLEYALEAWTRSFLKEVLIAFEET